MSLNYLEWLEFPTSGLCFKPVELQFSVTAEKILTLVYLPHCTDINNNPCLYIGTVKEQRIKKKKILEGCTA